MRKALGNLWASREARSCNTKGNASKTIQSKRQTVKHDSTLLLKKTGKLLSR
jgi:hypothetical protein